MIRRSIDSAITTPSQPRMIPLRAIVPVARSIGAGTARPTASRSLRLRVHRLEHVVQQQRHLVELVVGAVVRASGMWFSATTVWATSASATRRCRVEKCDADDEPERVRQSDVLRAPARADALRGVQDAGGRELLDDVRHGRGGEARGSGQLDLRQAAVLLDGVDDAGSVGFTK